jgi:hypothetical protein
MEVVEALGKMNEFLNQSYLFRAFKFLLGFYLIVMVLAIIGILIRIWKDYTSVLFKGAGYKPELGKFQKRWNAVETQVESDNPDNWSAAVLECSQMLNEVLKAIGYEGDNLGERLNNLPAKQVSDIEKLKVVNEVKNKIVLDQSFKINQREAKVIRDTVGKVLDNYEMIEFKEK